MSRRPLALKGGLSFDFQEYIEERDEVAKRYLKLAKKMNRHRKGKAYNDAEIGVWDTLTGGSAVTAAIAAPVGIVAAPAVAAVAATAAIGFGSFAFGRRVIGYSAFAIDKKKIKKKSENLNQQILDLASKDNEVNRFLLTNVTNSPRIRESLEILAVLSLSQKAGLAYDAYNQYEQVAQGLLLMNILSGEICAETLNGAVAKGFPMLGISAGTEAAIAFAGTLGGATAAYGTYSLYKGVKDFKKPPPEMILSMKETAVKIKEETDAIRHLALPSYSYERSQYDVDTLNREAVPY